MHTFRKTFFYYKIEHPVESGTFLGVENYGKLSSNVLVEEKLIFLPVSSSARVVSMQRSASPLAPSML